MVGFMAVSRRGRRPPQYTYLVLCFIAGRTEHAIPIFRNGTETSLYARPTRVHDDPLGTVDGAFNPHEADLTRVNDILRMLGQPERFDRAKPPVSASTRLPLSPRSGRAPGAR